MRQDTCSRSCPELTWRWGDWSLVKAGSLQAVWHSACDMHLLLLSSPSPVKVLPLTCLHSGALLKDERSRLWLITMGTLKSPRLLFHCPQGSDNAAPLTSHFKRPSVSSTEDCASLQCCMRVPVITQQLTMGVRSSETMLQLVQKHTAWQKTVFWLHQNQTVWWSFKLN